MVQRYCLPFDFILSCSPVSAVLATSFFISAALISTSVHLLDAPEVVSASGDSGLSATRLAQQ
jgi:hypothetical protein